MLRICIVAALLTCPATAFAQGLPLSELTIHAFDPQAWSEVEGVVMDNAGALPVEFNGQRALADIVAEHCPGAGEDYLAKLPRRLRQLNPALGPDSEVTLATPLGVEKGRTSLFLPYCLGATAKRYTVQPDDTLWGIFKSQEEAPDGIRQWEVFVDESTRLNGADFGDALPSGKSIVLPSEQLTVVVPEKSAETLLQQLRSVDALGDVRINPQNWGALEATNMLVTTDQDDACTTDSELEVLENAERRFWDLAEALMFNDAVDDASPRWTRRLDAVRLAVFDTGVHGSQEPLMQRLTRPLSQAFPPDDSIALSGHAEAFHGTGVLFAAAGGHLFSAFNSIFDAVTISPYRLYRAQCEVRPDGTAGQCGFTGDPGRLIQALTEASDRSAEIAGVNISLSFLNGIVGFERFVGPEQPLLIVTSAGNKAQVLGNSYRVYPAMFGGTERSNLITVAAVSLDNQLLPSSNRSPRHVDLAAWGCNVPVVEYDESSHDFGREFRSGTSYAAPQVLFLAAMILREQRSDRDQLSPAELKIRLAASSDLVPDLWDMVKHGRVANLAKALSVHTDVVELKSGELLLGRVWIDGDSGLEVRLCGDASVPRDDILKITDLGVAPENEPGAKRYVIYALEPAINDPVNRDVEFKWCDGIVAQVGFEDVLSGEMRDIPITDIKDIVMAATPYWR